jgi:hypothetical protein
MVDVVSTWERFLEQWSGQQNVLLRGEVFPYRYDFPPLATLIDTVRQDEKAHIMGGGAGDRLLEEDRAAEFRALPLAEAVRAPVQLAHYDLGRFTGPGQILYGLDKIVERWQAALAARGFSWTRVYPILFLSGPQCHTNYHIDRSHVLAWQVVGKKRFCWLKDPERWCPREARRSIAQSTPIARPPGLRPDDVIEVEMGPGDVLWNTVLTPHWVYAPDETSYSINIAHWDLRRQGQLAPLGREVEEFLREREQARAT